MSERGVFAVDRGVFDHPMFAAEPFTEREAWMWLVGAAAWKQCRVRAGRRPITVERGQAAFSERFMAVKWKWSKSRVHRFLDRLKIDAMVSVSTDHETNLITICNYEKYAFDGTARRSKNEPQTEPLSDQPRTKEEELKEQKKEEKKDTRAVAVATRPLIADPFEEFWKAYPRRDGANPKAPAKKLFIAAVKAGADPPAIVEGARRCAITESEKIGTPYIPQAVKWLRDRRWEDYAAGGAAAAPASDLSDAERKRKFEQLRSAGNVESEGKNLRRVGAGARALEGDGRQEPAAVADNQTRHSGMVSLGGLFQRAPGLSTGCDEAGAGGIEPGDDGARSVARPV